MGYLDVEALRSIPNNKERYNAIVEAVDEVRMNLWPRILEELNMRGYRPCAVAQGIGASTAMFSKNRVTNRFSLPTEALVKLSRMYLKQSCHEILFGEPGVTQLPNHLSCLVAEMQSSITRTQLSKVSAICKSACDNARNQGTFAPERSSIEILRQRIDWIAQDQYRSASELFCENATMRQAFYGSLISLDRGLGIGRYMVLAIELNTTVDYLISQDFMLWTPMTYTVGETTRPVFDYSIDILYRLLQLDEKTQIDTIGKMLSQIGKIKTAK